MSKFGSKLILWLVVIVLALGGVSLAITTVGIERYYLATQKAALNKVYEEMREIPLESIYKNTYALGKEYEVLLLTIPWEIDVDQMNERLKNAFIEQGILVKKLWLWEQDAKRLEEGAVINQIYNQGGNGYSLLIKYYRQEDTLIMISRTLPHIDDILKIINLFILSVWLIALGLMIVCIVLYVRRMTKPLVEMEGVVKAISELHFQQMAIDTGDELESLANGINTMSNRLQLSHKQLEEKNKQMQELLANVSHELKTPIALIKAYGIAIEDGMDDGTFLQTILEQNEVMEKMVNKLLMLAKKKQQETVYEEVQLTDVIQNYLKDYEVYSDQVKITAILEEVTPVWTDEEAVKCAIGNFISNGCKYTADGKVRIRCYEEHEYVIVQVRNTISQKGKQGLEQLWEPFYVGEDSRNKALCGTGLGLYITKKLLEKASIDHGCLVEEDAIIFYIRCKKS